MRIATLMGVLGGACGGALAGVGPYTETFTGGDAGWLTGSFNPPSFDPGGFISTSADVSTAGEFGLTLFRGHDDFDASGDAFVGDYLAAGLDTVTFDIRHDSDVALSFALRVASGGNSPAFVVLSPAPAAGGAWTTLSFSLDPGSPFYIPEGPPGFGFFAGVMGEVGNLQVLVLPPPGLPSGSVVAFDLDNVSTTPAPATMATVFGGLLLAARRRR